MNNIDFLNSIKRQYQELVNLNRYELEMSTDGIAIFSSAIKDRVGNANLCLHTVDYAGKENIVLSVGTCMSGVYNRWVKDKNSLLNTFLWSIGEGNGQYGKNNAEKHLAYLAYFAQLAGLKTKISVIEPKDREKQEDIVSIGKMIYTYLYNPVLDRFLTEIRSINNSKIKMRFSGFGDAKEYFQVESHNQYPRIEKYLTNA